MFQLHPYHMVFSSLWPISLALIVLSLFSLFSLYLMKSKVNFYLFIVALLITSLWWKDVNEESTFQGYHSSFAYTNMRYGMIFFIISEVFFFLSFFWAFFHSSLTPNIELGAVWPPQNLNMVNPFDLPLLNSIILLSSGVTVTISHQLLINKKMLKSANYLVMTILMGVYFSIAQLTEYNITTFSLNDSSYGSTFFITTGFHGFHVLVGSILLGVMLTRINNNYISDYHHVGYESSVWYWHFVDVVWLFLFTFIYWWIY